MDEQKRPVGRPYEYRAEYADRLIAFCDPDANLAKSKLPLLARFAWDLGVTSATVYNWAHDKNQDGSLRNPEFFAAYQRAKDAQQEVLAHGALNGQFNASFAALTAKNILGWRDKQDLEHSGPNSGPMQFESVSRNIVDPVDPQGDGADGHA